MEDSTRRCRGRASARGQAAGRAWNGLEGGGGRCGIRTAPVPTPRGILVERPRAGDRVAFERLLERWLERSPRTACAVIGDKADADATQKVKTAEAASSARQRDRVPCAGRSDSPGLAAR